MHFKILTEEKNIYLPRRDVFFMRGDFILII